MFVWKAHTSNKVHVWIQHSWSQILVCRIYKEPSPRKLHPGTQDKRKKHSMQNWSLMFITEESVSTSRLLTNISWQFYALRLLVPFFCPMSPSAVFLKYAPTRPNFPSCTRNHLIIAWYVTKINIIIFPSGTALWLGMKRCNCLFCCQQTLPWLGLGLLPTRHKLVHNWCNSVL